MIYRNSTALLYNSTDDVIATVSKNERIGYAVLRIKKAKKSTGDTDIEEKNPTYEYKRFDTLFNEYYYSRKVNDGISIENIKEAAKQSSKLNIFLFSLLIATLTSMVLSMLISLMFIVDLRVFSGVSFLISIVCVCVLAGYNGNRKSEYKYFKSSGRVYSNSKIATLCKILNEYGIDTKNTDSLKGLLDEAEKNKVKYDYLAQYRKRAKSFSALIVAAVTYIASKGVDYIFDKEKFPTIDDDLLTSILVIVVVLVVIFVANTVMVPLLDNLIKSKYHFHDELMEDIRQLIIFDESKSEASSESAEN